MGDPCERALAEYQRQLSLPIYSKMNDHDVDRVIEAVRDVVVRNSVRRTFGFVTMAASGV